MTLQRYNIALLPIEQAVRDDITAISRNYFLDLQDEYILGSEGLPHVTLCQFKTDNLETAQRVYQAFAAQHTKTAPPATIEKFNVRPGTLINAGKFIAEYKVKPQPELIELQAKCAAELEKHGLQSLTPTDTYNPHITLARLSASPDRTPSLQDLAYTQAIQTRISLGLSSESGVFIKELT